MSKKDELIYRLLMTLIWTILILIVLGLVGFGIWEVIAQIKYDGQWIQWRFIPLW